MDIFTPRTMLRALELLVPLRRFLIDTFFTQVETHDTEAIDIDIVNGTRRMAPFVNPNLPGKIIERKGFSTKSYKPPYIKPKMVTTAGDTLKRRPGEIIYGSGATPASRAMQILVQDMQTLDDMITRREEWMVAQALFNGTIRVFGDGVDDTIDFLFSSEQKPVLTGGRLWSAPTTAKPLDDFRAWKAIAAKNGKSLNKAIMSPVVFEKFLACDQIKDAKGAISSIQVTLGKINPTEVGDGVVYCGRIDSLGLDLYTYEEWYFDDKANKEYPLVPETKVLLSTSSARFTRHYGVIQDLDAIEQNMFAVQRYPKTWTERDPSARLLTVQSAPLPVPHEVDAIVVATVL